MIPETEKSRDNRAVTAFFRAFGGNLRVPPADAVRLADTSAGHRMEWRTLSLIVPLVLGAAVFDALWRLGGPWLAWPGVLPGVFAALHLAAFTLGGKTPRDQWLRWEALLTWWVIARFFWLEDGGTGWAVLLWLLVLACQALGLLALGWRKLMLVPGRSGIRLRIGIVIAAHVAMIAAWLLLGWQSGVACGLLIAAAFCWGTLKPGSKLYGPVATRVEADDILITIDDGPDPQHTPAILDLLDAHGRKAVFFVIGDKVRRFPDLARLIVARGHELGNHTMTHPQSDMWRLGPSRTRREIEDCNRAIEEATGLKPRWFRAPVGHRNFFTHPIAAGLGLEVVAWKRRAFDTVSRDVPGIVRKLTAGAAPGDILLLHEATPVTLEAMSTVLAKLE